MDKNDYLQAMGIQAWRSRDAVAATAPEPVILQQATGPDSWQVLREEVPVCTKCDLHKSRTQTVFGVGSEQASLMVIGEAPGFHEDQQGEPFVGRAGLLLTEMIKAIGLTRDDVFIANILKCRPPNNRDPLPAEVKSCTPYLKRQIALIQPKLIVAVGRISAQFLLESSETLGKLRNKQHAYEGTPLIVTYHPAYLLRSPREKAKAWLDWQVIRGLLPPA